MERESRTLEYKQEVSKTYLKTVSAFANYESGRILFGVTDNLQRKGVENPEEVILKLENQINDNIRPRPDFRFQIDTDNVIILEVHKGVETPYCYQGKAYKRNDSSTVEVSSIEYKNLVLRGMNTSFTDIPALKKDLTFKAFEELFTQRVEIPVRFPDTWITLRLYSSESGFTNGALLLSDQNPFPGIDVVVYGKDHNTIRKRVTLENESVVTLIEKCMNLFLEHYTYETIEGLYRNVKEAIPSESFREGITNAVAHREWQIPARIKVEMFPEYVAVTSPGGLPDGLDREDYLSKRHITILRNQSLALVFLRLNLIENLGSGIPKILAAYSDALVQPSFQITNNMISLTLPALRESFGLSPDQLKILNIVRLNGPISSKALQQQTGIPKATMQRILNILHEKRYVVKSGKGPGVRYFVEV